MKILVTAKRVPDPEQKVKLKDGAIDLTGMNFVVNPFDEYAVETALRLTEEAPKGKPKRTKESEVVVLSIGGKDSTQQIRSCLAMGADRAILVKGADDDMDSEQIARIIAKVVETEKPDLLLMGKQTVDGENNQVPQLVAGYLNMPQACFAGQIEVNDDSSLTVGREIDGGMEFKKVKLPAVVSVDLRIVLPAAVNNHKCEGHEYAEGPRYASLKGIMKAKKKTIDKYKPEKLGVTLAQRVKITALEAPPERLAGVRVETVEELVEKLQNEAKVL